MPFFALFIDEMVKKEIDFGVALNAETFLVKHDENGREELYCVKGDMGLSQVVRHKFEERYGAHPAPQSPNSPFHYQFDGGLRWFCPGDGQQLDARLACPKCGKHLQDLVHALTDLHPHKRDGRY
ncbi:MAG TPA: hypothetical protein VKR06_39995 [Ktedonosporobacter sp.]|nr:hypothetical protein [Ktedonosporobacter sp.]